MDDPIADFRQHIASLAHRPEPIAAGIVRKHERCRLVAVVSWNLLAGDRRDTAHAQHFAPRPQLVMPADARDGLEAGSESGASYREASESAGKPDAGRHALPCHGLIRCQQ